MTNADCMSSPNLYTTGDILPSMICAADAGKLNRSCAAILTKVSPFSFAKSKLKKVHKNEATYEAAYVY